MNLNYSLIKKTVVDKLKTTVFFVYNYSLLESGSEKR